MIANNSSRCAEEKVGHFLVVVMTFAHTTIIVAAHGLRASMTNLYFFWTVKVTYGPNDIFG